mgnify:CR=1 FL=1
MSWLKDKILLRVGMMLLLTLLDHIAFAQRCPLVHYTKENGLPSNMVYDVYRDSRGFMWIATDKGVARFDGASFQTFTTEDGLPDNEVFFFQEDYQNRIWLATYSGALCYYKNGIFHNAYNTPFVRIPLKPDVPIHITVQKDSSIIVYYKNQEGFINIKDDDCSIYEEDVKDRKYGIPRNIYKISDSIYCFRYERELCYLNVRTGASRCSTMQKSADVSFCQNQEFLFNSEYIYDRNDKKVAEMPESLSARTRINRIYFDGEKHLIATDDGIWINRRRLLNGQRIPSATEDIAGCYWVPTFGDGIYRINKDFEKSRFVRTAYTGVVTYACSYGGASYFATTDRHLYELKNGTIKLLLDFSEGIPNIKNQGYHIDCALHKNLLYCAGRKGTIFVYDLLGRRVRKFKLPGVYKEYLTAFPWKYVIATASGLNSVSAREICFIPYACFGNDGRIRKVQHIPFQNRMYAVTLNDKNNLLHSRTDRIYTTEGTRTLLQPQYGKRLFIWMRYQYNTLVGCTPANELFLLSAEGREIRMDFSPFKGAVWEGAYPLSQDRLLLSSGRRYYTLSLPGQAKRPVRVQPITDPFIPAETEYILSDTGNCYFFKNGSITVIDKAVLLKPPPTPSLFFDKIIMADSVFRVGKGDSELTLTARHTATARIVFEVLAFDPDHETYEYSIVKEDDTPLDWQSLTNREVNLLLPQYGTVKIFARARNHEGRSSRPVRFTIIILKPWWARWWGITVITLFSIAAVGGLFYFLIRRAIKRKEKEHDTKIRMLNAEFRSLNAMMNPHFIFNTLNNIQGFINADSKAAANEYIRTFSDMVRQNMVNISKEWITLANEMTIVERYLKLQQLRYRNIAHEMVINPAVDPDEVIVPPLLLQPLVENSIKHGILPAGRAEGFIRIIISGTDDEVTIEVIDNGIGISRSAARNDSFALKSLKKRIDAVSFTRQVHIRFDISDYTYPPYESGTRVVLVISYRS